MKDEFFIGAIVRRKDGKPIQEEEEGVVAFVDYGDNTLQLYSGIWATFDMMEVVGGISYEDQEL